MRRLPDIPLGPEYKQLLDLLQDPIVAADGSDAVIYANAAAERLLGWTPAELVGMPLTAIMPPRFRAAHEGGFRRFMTTRRPKMIGRPVRVPVLHRHGIEVDVELTLSELEPSPGTVLIVAMLRDLRERLELEQKVASQRKILAQYAAVGVLASATTAVETMPRLLEATAAALGWDIAVYWAVDPATTRLRLSASWASAPETQATFLAGCSELTFAAGEGLPGKVLETAKPLWSKDVRTDDRYVRARMAKEHGVRSALLFPVYGARRTWGVLEYLSAREEEPDEELLQSMAALGFQVGQFLERLDAERQLRDAFAQAEAERNNLHTLLMQTPAAIAIVRGSELRYELSNPANQRLAGGRPLVGKTIREALPELEADGTIAMVRRVYETGEPFVVKEMPITLPAAEGRPEQPIFMDGVVQPLRGGSGAIEGAMAFAYEVTDLVVSRERLREAEERLRLAIEAGNVGTFDYHHPTGRLRCDARYKALFGLSEHAEASTAIFAAAIHPDDQARVQAAVAASWDAASGGEFEADYRIRGVEDGIERWGHMRGSTSFDERGEPVRFVGTGVDVTESRRALERLEFLEQVSRILSGSLDYRATLQQVADLSVPRLADWCMVEVVNELGETERVALAHVDPAKLELAHEARRLYPPDPKAPSSVAQVIASGKPLFTPVVSDEMLVRAARGEAHLALLREVGLRSSMMLPLLVQGGAIGVLALFHAESGRRYTSEDLAFAEEVARRAALAIENARLYDRAIRAVGVRDQFLSIASHELRTPLTALLLQIATFKRMFDADKIASMPREKLARGLVVMANQGERLAQLIDELLDVTRISSGHLTLDRAPVDLVEIVREAVSGLTAYATQKGVALEGPGGGPVVGRWDRARLEQVVVNLVENAIKHATEGKRVEIATELAGRRAFLRVRDHGPGIAARDHERIFEQFERAVSPNLGGLGLGLWIVRQIVEAHGGAVHVESSPGAGATFVVELPLDPPASP
jgi:PAS domain S-box-containing protein